MRIALTGANSSVGQALLRQVAGRDDLEVRAGVRRQQAADTLPTGPGILPCVIRYDDTGSLAALLDGAACLVHLAGILIESEHTTYQTANVDATRAVVDASRHAAVRHIVFISSLGADPGSHNAYFRSKGLAEQLVTESGLSSTVIRTPILLGPGTAGVASLVAVASRRSVRVLGGGHHLLRPLDIDDLSHAILNCCRDQPAGATVHELVGPEPVSHRDLIGATGRRLGHDVTVGGVPVWAAKLGAVVAGWFRRGGMTTTVIDVITSDETVRVNAATDLGVTLTPLSETLAKIVPQETP